MEKELTSSGVYIKNTSFRVKHQGWFSFLIRNLIDVNQRRVASGFLFRNYLSNLEKYPNTRHGICTGDMIVANILRTDDLVLMVDLLNDLSVYFPPNFPGDWRSRSVTVCFSCARNFVFQHKINFCVDVERMMCFLCVWLYFICVSLEFVLGSCAFPLS